MTSTDRPRRSALYLPASNARAIEKARSLPADILILDLEDAVAPEAKEEARTAAAAARSHEISILDGVCNEFRDLDVFRAEARQGLLFGFDGKSLIHPAQVEPCNAIFSPGEEALAKARTVIAAFDLPENLGKGVIRLDGKMVELLHLDQARRIVAIAQRIAN
jgi:citrate lyase beta subunit